MNKDAKNQKIALYAILGALSLVLSLFENVLLPPLPFFPAGAKPGLSNIVVMFSSYALSSSAAVYIMLLKVMFSFVTRGATAAAMSLCGGILSVSVLSLLIKKEGKSISFISIGILCAVSHNMGQLFCSAVISGTWAIFNYAKYLFVFALISGSFTGIILNLLKNKMTKSKIKFGR